MTEPVKLRISANDLPTLYSTDSRGKVRKWEVNVDGLGGMTVTHGLDGGKLQTKSTVAKPKNIGKANETTPNEQAELEAHAKWKFQMDREDYHFDINLANRQIRPMLALDYNKVPKRVNWDDAVVQPKLDGLRLTVGRRFRDVVGHEMMTRKGEIYDVPHLTVPTHELLSEVNALCDNRCLALDGEAYIHGMPLQKITSLARKYQKGVTETLEFHLFDLIIPDMSFVDRHTILVEALRNYGAGLGNVFALVHYEWVSDEAEMKDFHGRFTERGYEGLMIRHASGEYGIARRSPELFKYKQFLSDEACITDVWEDNNQNAMLTVLMKNGKSCKVTPKRSHEARKQMLTDREDFIGKWITVKYQGLTEDGIFQFPIGMDLRECDSNGEPLV